jgi:hypothetical protein
VCQSAPPTPHAEDLLEDLELHRSHEYYGALDETGYKLLHQGLNAPMTQDAFTPDMQTLCAQLATNIAHRHLPKHLAEEDRHGHVQDIVMKAFTDLTTQVAQAKEPDQAIIQSVSRILMHNIRATGPSRQNAKKDCYGDSDSYENSDTRNAMNDLTNLVHETSQTLGMVIEYGNPMIEDMGRGIDEEHRARGRQPNLEWWKEWMKPAPIPFDPTATVDAANSFDPLTVASTRSLWTPVDDEQYLTDYSPETAHAFRVLSVVEGLYHAHATQVRGRGGREITSNDTQIRSGEQHRRNTKAQPRVKKVKQQAQWVCFMALRTEVDTGVPSRPQPARYSQDQCRALRQQYGSAPAVDAAIGRGDRSLTSLFGATTVEQETSVLSTLSTLPPSHKVEAVRSMIALSSESEKDVCIAILSPDVPPQRVVDLVFQNL